MPYQLCLCATPLAFLIDRIAEDANAVAPGLGRPRARELADLLLRARIRQTVACGRAGVCGDVGHAAWGAHHPQPMGEGRACHLTDEDPYDLPNMFAVAASDTLDLRGQERDALEQRLAGVFRAALAPVVFESPHCGLDPACRSAHRDPFA